MRRITILLLVLILIFQTGLASADVGVNGKKPDAIKDLRLIDPNDPNKGIVYTEIYDPQGAKKITLVTRSIVSEGTYQVMVRALKASAASKFQSEFESSDMSFGEMLRTANWKLLKEGRADVYRALSNVMSEGMENLNDPYKRMEFWKKYGFYDKYTTQELKFLNKVVLREVAWELGLLGTGCSVLAGAVLGGKAGSIAPGLGTATGTIVGGFAGAGAFWAGVGYKTWRVEGGKFEIVDGGSEVPFSPPNTEPGTIESEYPLPVARTSVSIYMNPSEGGDITSIREASKFSIANQASAISTSFGAIGVAATGEMLSEAQETAQFLRAAGVGERIRGAVEAIDAARAAGSVATRVAEKALAQEVAVASRAMTIGRVAGIVKGGLQGLGATYCAAKAVEVGYELVGLYNAFDIPIPAGDPTKILAEELKKPQPNKGEETDIKIIYRLTR